MLTKVRSKAEPQKEYWTHANATEHMYEDVVIRALKEHGLDSPRSKLYSQFILYDYRKSLSSLLRRTDFEHGKLFKEGKWEFIVVKPRKKGQNPVIKHAQFLGWGKDKKNDN